MKCPLCRSDENYVVKTAATDTTVRRRRQCRQCGHRWTTIEGMEDTVQELAHIKRALAPVARLLH